MTWSDKCGQKGMLQSFFHETWLMVANSCLDVDIKQ